MIRIMHAFSWIFQAKPKYSNQMEKMFSSNKEKKPLFIRSDNCKVSYFRYRILKAQHHRVISYFGNGFIHLKNLY